jgi:signal transduction histidine kinase
MTLKDIRPPEDIDALLKDVEKTRRSYNPAGEWRHLKKNGELISVVIISHTITFRNRKARHVMITDITEQKNADDKIKDSEEKFRSLFTKSPLGIAYNEMILDKDGKAVDYRFLEVNDAYKKIIGIDPTGKKVTEAFPGIENYSFNWIGTFGHVATKGEKIHFEQFFENTGRWYDCVAFQSRINQYAVVFQDITERRNAEEEIHRLSERISTATRAAQLGIWDWDVENNKLVWDDQMYQLYGLKKEVFSVAYDAWLRGLHPDDRAFSQEASEMALRKEKDYDTEFRVVWPDGSLHVLKAKGDVFLNDEGKPVRMTGVNYDITEIRSITEKIKKLNEELEIRVKERTSQLEASNKELEAFSYSVSHDLRSPLRHINGFAEILTKQYSENLPDEARNYINTIVGSAKKMGILIDDLLSFSRAGRAELKKSLVKMNLIVDDAVLHLKPSFSDRKVELSISSLPEVYGDYNLLRMVWINLLDNALKYSLPREVAEIRIGYKEEENEFVFYTQDNGVGFDMKYAQKLFGVFQRLHSSAQFDGTGIGLANVQRIILRHGGRTWAEAETDKGATFYFSIPK